ncbi:MAG: VOC family protein [Chloroflexi bacterium]|nr:VOC family protein [Chloroflexota bacterium]
MYTRIHNIVIAVKNLEEATKLYTEGLGFHVARFGSGVSPWGLKNVFLSLGDATIELVEPIDPQQGPVAKFLQNRGEGVYMLHLGVENLDSAIQALTEKGIRLLGADPESRAKGSEVFIHPQSTKGVLIEISEDV